MKAPVCRICQHEHWLSVNCKGEPHQPIPKPDRAGKPAKAPANDATAEKARPGKPKTAQGTKGQRK